MRAKLLVTAVALGNLALGLSAGVVLGRRASERAEASSPTLSPAELPSTPVEVAISPAPATPAPEASPAPVASSSRAHPDSRSRSRWRGHRRHHRRGRHRGPEFMLRHLEQAVGMDEAQVEAAKAIMTRSHERVRGLLEGVRPKMHEIQAETHAELRALLRPEQQKKLDALKEAMERRGPPWRWDKRRRGKRGDRWGRWGRRGEGRGHPPRGERGPRRERGPHGERGPREGDAPDRGPRGPEGHDQRPSPPDRGSPPDRDSPPPPPPPSPEDDREGPL